MVQCLLSRGRCWTGDVGYGGALVVGARPVLVAVRYRGKRRLRRETDATERLVASRIPSRSLPPRGQVSALGARAYHPARSYAESLAEARLSSMFEHGMICPRPDGGGAMNYAEIKYFDIANGEGVRTSIFVSGCRRGVPGCFNSGVWSFLAGKPFTQEVEDKIIESLDHPFCEGLTILRRRAHGAGEPGGACRLR